MNFNEYFALSVGEGWDKSQKREIKIVISGLRYTRSLVSTLCDFIATR